MTRERYRIDDVELDVGARRARRGTEELQLAGHALDVFVELARRAPNVVSVEGLLEAVWPDVFVGEENVKQQVLHLRRALDDDPAAPRYIANVRGHGYQLIARTVALGPAADLHEVPVDPVTNQVFVSRFANRSTDPALDPLTYLLSDGLTRQLAATELLDVIPGAMFPFATEEHPPAATLLETACAAGSTALVRGQIFKQGDQVVVDADVVDVSSGSVRATFGPLFSDTDSPVELLEELSAGLVPAVAATTDRSMLALLPGARLPASLETYKVYSLGLDAFARLEFAAAAEQFLAAARSDAGFAYAGIMAALALINLDRLAEARAVAGPLVERRSSLLPVERSLVDYLESNAHLRSDDALVAARRVAALAPRSPFAMEAARQAVQRNQIDEALARFESIEATDNPVRDYLPYHFYRSCAFHASGLEEEEAAVAADVLRRFPSQIGAAWIAARSAVSAGRVEEVRRLALSVWQLEDSFGHTPAGVTWMILGELHTHGFAAEAESLLADAVARRRGFSGLDMASRYDWARLSLLAGDTDIAISTLTALHEELPDRLEIAGLLAVARAQRGEQTRQLEEALAALARQSGMNAEGLFWKAAIAAARGDLETGRTAVEESLREGFPYWGPIRVTPISPQLHANPLLLPLHSRLNT